MKTIIIIIAMLLCIEIPIFSQLFATVEPQFLRAGILYTDMRAPVYGKIWYGDINGEDFHTDNIKIGAGAFIRGKQNVGAFVLGLNYNFYFNTFDESEGVDLKRMKPLSIDFGFSVKITKRIWTIMITDPINWESCFGLGFDLQSKQHIYDYNYMLLK